MSKPLKIIGRVAGILSTVLMFVPGGQPFAIALAAVSAVATFASGALAKPPPARGSVSQMIIAADAPQPYVMGEGYTAGVLRHRTGYGGTVDGVENPYLFDVVVYSGGGPVQSISPRVDQATVAAWFTGYLATDTQLGACPESTALTASYGTPTGWGASHKLSGQAAIAWNFKFDKKGKRYASGLPQTGAMVEGVKVYDPRLDDTFPGGSGAHRLGTESTYAYSENPALHAGTYAYGRYQNGKRVLGIGLPADGIDWEKIADWANVCDTNGWTMFGIAYEPGDKGQNLIDICAAGGGEPVPGGKLSFRYHAPVVALDTITEADIADEDKRVTMMQSYRDRINIVIPKYRSPTHNWEMVQADAVSDPDFVTEDGEERPIEWPFNFCKDVDQAAQLAAYKLFEARELHPIELTCMPRLRAYRPGDCLHLDLPELGLDTDAVILRREIDPASMKVRLTLIGETPAKHAWALGLAGDAPATPAVGQTPQERDETAAAGTFAAEVLAQLIGSSYVTDADPADGLLQAAESAGTTTITVETHTRTYQDIASPVSVTGAALTLEDDGTTALATETTYHIYYDDADRAGGAVSLKATQTSTVAATSGTNPGRHYVGSITTPAVAGSTQSGGATPSGWKPDFFYTY